MKRTILFLVFIAVFDEVDEGTAIFKVTNTPPVGLGAGVQFVTYEGLPCDHYLRLTGVADEGTCGQRPPSDELPLPVPSKP